MVALVDLGSLQHANELIRAGLRLSIVRGLTGIGTRTLRQWWKDIHGVSPSNGKLPESVLSYIRDRDMAARLSAEPLLGELDIERYMLSSYDKAAHDSQMLGTECRTNKLNWVVAGGESGPRARPAHPDWVRSLRDQCEERGIPFHLKQWGEWMPGLDASNEQIDAARTGGWVHQSGGFHDGNNADAFRDGDAHVLRVGKKAAGRLLDGVLHDAYPEVA